MSISSTIYETLIHTPWWVYILFIYLVRIGIKASKPKEVSLIKLAIVPSLFFIFSLESLVKEVTPDRANILAYVITLIIGVIIGFFIAYNTGGKVVEKNHQKLIALSGSWFTLILILISFSIKYYFGFKLGFHPKLMNNLSFTVIMLSAYGLTSGIFIGRFIFYLSLFYRYKKI